MTPAPPIPPGCSLALRLAGILVVLAGAPASAGEACHFTGTTDYAGHLSIDTQAAADGNGIRLDVRLRLDAAPLPLVRTHYLMEEISFWRADGLARLAVNNRYSFDGHVVRQQWDVYDRNAEGLAAYRVQGKRTTDFEKHHPGFLSHWDAQAFGKPWLEDYARAAAERRPDLDLRHDMTRVRPPLALAFYWLRWLPSGGDVVPVFLPGFKEQKLVDVVVGAAPAPEQAGLLAWQATLHYPGLSPGRPSVVQAWATSGRQMRQLSFDLHGVEHSARAWIQQDGCIGTPPSPPVR